MISPFFVPFSIYDEQIEDYINNNSEINKMKAKGWYLCNGVVHTDPDNIGTNVGVWKRKTPDLRGRFILPGGAGVNLNPEEKIEGVIGSYYNHWGRKGGTYSTTLDVENLPDHSHTYEVWDKGTTAERETSNKAGVAIEPSKDNLSFTTKSNPLFESTAFSNIPPYYTLAYFIYWPKPWTWSYDHA